MMLKNNPKMGSLFPLHFCTILQNVFVYIFLTKKEFTCQKQSNLFDFSVFA